MSLFDKKGNVRLSVANEAGAGPIVRFMSGAMNQRLAVGVTDLGAAIIMHREDSKLRISLTENGLLCCDEAGRSRIAIGSAKEETTIVIADENGKTVWAAQ